MQLPNKLYSYRDSTLALLPVVLRELQNGSVPVVELYKRTQGRLNENTDFLAVMDCLYALRAVDINGEGEVFICL